MTNEEMLECFGDADVCVFAEDFDLVRRRTIIVSFAIRQS